MRAVTRSSAGLLLYRFVSDILEVLLVHPGGPFWARKDRGAWSIPKGEIDPGERPLDAARREFTEETGGTVDGEFIPLQRRQQSSGKIVHAWAVRGEFDPERLTSAAFSMEWPPHSGRQQSFPEVDRAGWFTLAAAREKIIPAQAGFLDELAQLLEAAPQDGTTLPGRASR
jgi:predicted NUDIX family NTP pyrophosphohydrolase